MNYELIDLIKGSMPADFSGRGENRRNDSGTPFFFL